MWLTVDEAIQSIAAASTWRGVRQAALPVLLGAPWCDADEAGVYASRLEDSLRAADARIGLPHDPDAWSRGEFRLNQRFSASDVADRDAAWKTVAALRHAAALAEVAA